MTCTPTVKSRSTDTKHLDPRVPSTHDRMAMFKMFAIGRNRRIIEMCAGRAAPAVQPFAPKVLS
jgi:hypothetical protein